MMTGPGIVLVDFGGTNMHPQGLMGCAHALQLQVQSQFSLPPPLGYGVSVSYVRVAKTPTDVHAAEWAVGFLAQADVAGALGYHDRTPHGQPFMKCFPLLDESDNAAWQVTASHELLETLADPELAKCAQAPDGTIWAYEVCDAVEEDVYMVAGVPVSNWNTPAWFEPPSDGTGVKYDWMGLCKSAFEIRPGGYGQTWDGSSWIEQQSEQKHVRAYRTYGHEGSRRRARRARLAAK